MRVKELIKNLKNLKISWGGNLDLNFKRIIFNSKKVQEGDLFFALKGLKTDGHRFIKEAFLKGAKIFVLEDKKFKKYMNFFEKNKEKIFWITTPDTLKLFSYVNLYFYKVDLKKFKFIGVTGTNGKTTVCFLTEKILKENRLKTSRISTINCSLNSKILKNSLTTPLASELFKILKKCEKESIEYVILEASSQGLEEKRLEPLEFKIAVFTNLSQDHLDYHFTLENYFKAKKRLFEKLSLEGTACINLDDSYGKRLYKALKTKKIGFGIKTKKDIYLKERILKRFSQELKIKILKDTFTIKTKLLGIYNIYNIMASLGVAVSLGLSLKRTIKALKEFLPPPGRLEFINTKRVSFVIDYAHTPSALKEVLNTLRELKFNRIITVFGCGGERDVSKRPLMGKIASSLSDIVIITDDNPRSESPQKIIRDILKGIKKSNFKIIRDRKKAIKYAIEIAEPRDCVLIAGKGHESYQIFKDKKIWFKDSFYVKKFLNVKDKSI